MSSSLPMLTRYTAWANDTLYQALAEQPESELLKKQKVVFGSLRRTLNRDELSDAKAAEILNFEFIGGGLGCMSRGDILLHVINHTTYRRGHIGDMIYQIPAQPPTTDLPVYLRSVARTL
jgi:uncharacterized damage-inducible protein DinB